MRKVLYIIANPNEKDVSYSRRVSDFFVEELQKKEPGIQVDIKDLYRDGCSLIDGTYLSARRKQALGQSESLTSDELQIVAVVDRAADEFVKYDRFVLSTPMWNFGVPPLLKAYIDQILIPGKTFKYTAEGPVGLLKDTGKKMVIVESSGGVYSEGPTAAWNHCSGFLKDVFHFIGIDMLKVLPVEGTAIPGLMEHAIDKAKKQALLALTEF